MKWSKRFIGLLAALVILALAFGGQAMGQVPDSSGSSQGHNPLRTLEEKVAELEARVAALESQGSGNSSRVVVNKTLDPTEPDEVLEWDVEGVTFTKRYAKIVIPGASIADLPILQLAYAPEYSPSVPGYWPEGTMALHGEAIEVETLVRDSVEGLEVLFLYNYSEAWPSSVSTVTYIAPAEDGLIHLTLAFIQ